MNLYLADIDTSFRCSSDIYLSFSHFTGIVLIIDLCGGAVLAFRPVGLCQQLPHSLAKLHHL